MRELAVAIQNENERVTILDTLLNYRRKNN